MGSLEYNILSPSLNPWFLKLIVSLKVLIPTGLTINLLLVYPLPPLITSISDNVNLLETVLNLWIPVELIPLNTTVLIPLE